MTFLVNKVNDNVLNYCAIVFLKLCDELEKPQLVLMCFSV